MSFTLFTPLFQKVDQITATYVTDISSKTIAAVTPVVSVGLTLSLILYGWLIIRGAVEMPVADFLNRCFRIGAIVSIALAGGLYQSDIAQAITTLPDDFASALISNPTQNQTAAGLIDMAISQGFDRAGEAFDKGGFFSSDGIIYGLFGIIILLTTGVLAAIGGAFILIGKIALALLVGLGPLFILALLWEPTQRFFEQWVAQVLNYVLLIVLFAAIFGLIMDIFSGYMAQMALDAVQSVAYGLGGCIVLSFICILVLLQLPNIASGLAGGVSLGYMSEMRAVGTGVGAGYRGGKNTLKGLGYAAMGLGRGVVKGGRVVAGYFRGRKGSS